MFHVHNGDAFDCFQGISLTENLHQNNKQKTISKKLQDIKSVVIDYNKQITFGIHLNKFILSVLDVGFYIISLLSSSMFLISAAYHLYIYSDKQTFVRFKEYFSVVFPTFKGLNIKETTKYEGGYSHKYTSHELVSSDKVKIAISIKHRMMDKMMAFKETPDIKGLVFCSLYTSTIPDIMPDSYKSLIILSINACLWSIYMMLLNERYTIKKWIFDQQTKLEKNQTMTEIISALLVCLKQKVDYECVISITKAIQTGDISLIYEAMNSIRDKVSRSKKKTDKLKRLIEANKPQSPTQRTSHLCLLVFLLNKCIEFTTLVQTKRPTDHFLVFTWEVIRASLVFVLQMKYSPYQVQVS